MEDADVGDAAGDAVVATSATLGLETLSDDAILDEVAPSGAVDPDTVGLSAGAESALVTGAAHPTASQGRVAVIQATARSRSDRFIRSIFNGRIETVNPRLSWTRLVSPVSFIRKVSRMARVAILVEKIYEDLELQYPKYRLREAGHVVDVIGPKKGETYIGKHGYPQVAEMSASDARAEDYDLLVIPGGTSPDHMRRSEHMVRLARDFAHLGKPMAGICHGPWLMCSTPSLRGRRCTSYMSIVDDVLNAGGVWVDEACVVDGNIITSRTPEDLPAFMKAILSLIETGRAVGEVGTPVAPAWVHATVKARG